MFRDNEFNHIVNRIMIYDSYVIERVLKWTEKTFLFASLGKKNSSCNANETKVVCII